MFCQFVVFIEPKYVEDACYMTRSVYLIILDKGTEMIYLPRQMQRRTPMNLGPMVTAIYQLQTSHL